MNAATEADIHHSVDMFTEAYINFGPTVSLKDTELMHQPAPGKTYTEPITINGLQLNAVNKFTYTCSTFTLSLVTKCCHCTSVSFH